MILAGRRQHSRVCSIQRLCAPEAALVHSAARVEGVLDRWPAHGAESTGRESSLSRWWRSLAAPVPRLRLESVSLFHFLVFNVNDLHEFPFERGYELPVFVQNFIWLRFDPLLHLPFELPFLSLNAAGAVAAVRIEYLQQVLDFDVLEVLWREILQNLGKFVEQKIFKSRVCLDFFNPVLPEAVVADGLVKISKRVVEPRAAGHVDDVHHFAKDLRRPVLFQLLEVGVCALERFQLVRVVQDRADEFF